MKNRVLLVLLLSFAVSLAASAQKITMNLQQVKLEKVFSLITKQTGLTVAYSRTIVNPERIVSVQAKDKDLSKVLDDLFAGTNVAYEIGEKKIYLKAKEAPAASQGSQKNKENNGNRDGYQRRTDNWCQCIGERSGDRYCDRCRW